MQLPSLVDKDIQFDGYRGRLCLLSSLNLWLQLGVTVHEFMLISICQCLCHLMIVSWSHVFVGFVVSVVSWFHRFRGVNSFMVS